MALFTFLLTVLPLLLAFSPMMMPIFLILITLITVWYARSVLRARPEYPLNTKLLFGSLGLFLIWATASGAWSILPFYSFQTGLRISVLIGLGIICFIYISMVPAPKEKALNVLLAGFTFVSVVLLLELLPNGGPLKVLYDALGISYDRFINKNINRGLCAYAVMVWPFIYGLLRAGKKREAWELLVVIALPVFAMHSLSAKLGLMMGLGAFISLAYFPKIMPRVLAVFFICYLLAFPLLFSVMENTFFAHPFVVEHLPPSAIHRLHIWHEHLSFALQKPWLGWGTDTARAMPMDDAVLKFLDLKVPPLHPHSPPLQIFLELGIIGLLIAVTTVGLFLRHWIRLPRHDMLSYRALSAIIVSYCATGISSYGVWQYWWISILFIALALWRHMGRISPTPAMLYA